MNKRKLILTSILLLSSLVGVLLNFNNPDKTLIYKFENFDIKLNLTECTTCFLEWPIEYEIKITSEKKSKSIKFDTETPYLLFAVNKTKDTLLFFGTTTRLIIYTASTFKELEPNLFSKNRDSDLTESFVNFKPYFIVTKQMSIKLIDSSRSIQSIRESFYKE